MRPLLTTPVPPAAAPTSTGWARFLPACVVCSRACCKSDSRPGQARHIPMTNSVVCCSFASVMAL